MMEKTLSEEIASLQSKFPDKYQVQSILGEGGFGQVIQCLKKDTGDTVAVKIPIPGRNLVNELAMLSIFRCFDLDQYNIIRFIETFTLTDHRIALVCEKLDASLFDYITDRRDYIPMELHEIRRVIQQVATALDVLKNRGIIHADVKEDNIMLVDCEEKPITAKLIDFGLAFPTHKARRGLLCQAEMYRAPEIHLGLPFSEAIDMWSLGIVMASMMLSYSINQGGSRYDKIRRIVDLLGMPPDHLLNNGWHTERYFIKTSSGNWRLKTPAEYWGRRQYKADEHYPFRSLDELETMYQPNLDAEGPEAKKECIDLLRAMLHLDAKERITPAEVLKHPFITRGSGQHSSDNEQPGTSKTEEREGNEPEEPGAEETEEPGAGFLGSRSHATEEPEAGSLGSTSHATEEPGAGSLGSTSHVTEEPGAGFLGSRSHVTEEPGAASLGSRSHVTEEPVAGSLGSRSHATEEPGAGSLGSRSHAMEEQVRAVPLGSRSHVTEEPGAGSLGSRSHTMEEQVRAVPLGSRSHATEDPGAEETEERAANQADESEYTYSRADSYGSVLPDVWLVRSPELDHSLDPGNIVDLQFDNCLNDSGFCGSTKTSSPHVVLVQPAPPDRCYKLEEDSQLQHVTCSNDSGFCGSTKTSSPHVVLVQPAPLDRCYKLEEDAELQHVTRSNDTSGRDGSTKTVYPRVILVQPAPPDCCYEFNEQQSELCTVAALEDPPENTPADNPKKDEGDCPVCHFLAEDRNTELTATTADDTDTEKKTTKKKKKKNCIKRFFRWFKKTFCCCVSVSDVQD